MKWKVFLLLFCSFGSVMKASSDTTDLHVIQITGVILSADSLDPVPFTNVIIKNTHQGTISDFSGYFSILANEGDTLIFSNIGYKNEEYAIPDTLSKNNYSLIQILTADTITFDEITISRWPSYEQFKYAFENMDIPEDDYDRAKKNLDELVKSSKTAELKSDGSLAFKQQMQEYNNQLYYAGQLPPNNLLNPFAWIKFIEAWKNGELKLEK